MNDENWMKIALKLAKKARSRNEIPVGAILVLNEKIIGKGWNQSVYTNDPTSHAEIIAIREGGKKIKNYRILNATLYVTLEPCMMCLGALIHARIQTLVFGASEKKYDSSLNLFLNRKKWIHKITIKKGILKEDCGNQLKKFFYKKRH